MSTGGGDSLGQVHALLHTPHSRLAATAGNDPSPTTARQWLGAASGPVSAASRGRHEGKPYREAGIGGASHQEVV